MVYDCVCVRVVDGNKESNQIQEEQQRGGVSQTGDDGGTDGEMDGE